MATKRISTRVQNKHDTEANWNKATNFIPLAGELIVYDADSTHTYQRFKIGDGKTAVSSLPFLHTVRTGGDVTVDSSGNITVNDDSHAHVISNVDGLQTKINSIDAEIAAKANISHTHTVANISDLTATATELNYMDGVTSNVQTQLDKKINDFTLEIYNGTGGNPKPVRFASFNYSACSSEEGIAAKISLVSGHGNGSSYAFLQDAIIRVTHLGGVQVDNFKYYGAETGNYDGAERQYGDIFWLTDTTNKIVDFYCLMGQYARMYQTPWKRLTYSSKGTVTQHTSCTVYSSGTKTWANNSDIALMSDLNSALSGKANASHTHAIDNVTNLQSTLDAKATQTSLDAHASNTTLHTNATERTNWNTAYTHSQAAHAPSNAEKNQNAFSNVAVSGQTTVSADSATDTLTLVAGSNVTITTDATNDKITIAATDTKYTHPSTHAASMITGLATVATSGKYADLSGTPTIPTVNNATLTIQKNGTNVATFTANSSSNATANITVPTGAAADKGVDTSISASSTSTNLPTSKAVAAFVEGKGYKTTDNNTTYTVSTGDSNGQIKVTPSSGSAYNVAVKGLGSAAYTASTAYAASSHTHTKSQITDFPTSLPASDVYSWAKASSKPSYTASEVGALPVSQKGVAGGVAELDENGKIPASQLPESTANNLYTYGTDDLVAGESLLETGKLYFVYE